MKQIKKPKKQTLKPYKQGFCGHCGEECNGNSCDDCKFLYGLC